MSQLHIWLFLAIRIQIITNKYRNRVMPTSHVCVCVCVRLVTKHFTGAKLMHLDVEWNILPSVMCHKR